MTAQDYPRTIYEAKLDADYNVLLQDMQEMLYTRVNKTIVALNLVAVTGAFISVAGRWPVALTVFGLVVGTFAIIGAVNDFAGRSERHRFQRRRYAELAAADITELAVFDRQMKTIEIDDMRAIKSLQVAAYNANLRRHGRTEYLLAENKFVRAMAFLC